MGNELLVSRYLPRADIHSTVYLHGVGADDLGINRRGYTLGKCGFARCSRADYANDRSIGFGMHTQERLSKRPFEVPGLGFLNANRNYRAHQRVN